MKKKEMEKGIKMVLHCWRTILLAAAVCYIISGILVQAEEQTGATAVSYTHLTLPTNSLV